MRGRRWNGGGKAAGTGCREWSPEICRRVAGRTGLARARPAGCHPMISNQFQYKYAGRDQKDVNGRKVAQTSEEELEEDEEEDSRRYPPKSAEIRP